jgi:hypothetical protein
MQAPTKIVVVKRKFHTPTKAEQQHIMKWHILSCDVDRARGSLITLRKNISVAPRSSIVH